VYRKEIISSLLSLATNATPSLAADTDVYSTVGHFMDLDHMPEFDTGSITEQTEPFDVPQLLKFFDTTNLAFRDARYMRHKICALHVTLDNLDKFLYSVSTMRESKQLARRLWRSIQGSSTWSVTADCLNAVEKLWTDKDRELQAFQSPEQPFLVSFEVRSYLANGEYLRIDSDERPGQWDQIHELTYVAIAHDALQALRDRTKFSSRFLHMRLEGCPEVPKEWVIDLFERMRFAPVRRCFAAAMARSLLCSESSRASQDTRNSFAACPDAHGRVNYLVPFLTKSDLGSLAGLPWMMYKRLKVGMTEPSETFLRVSQQFSKDDPKRTCSERSPGWEGTYEIPPRIDALLMAGVDTFQADRQEREYSVRHCIFIFDLPPMNGHEGKDTLIKLAALPRALGTFLNIRHGNQMYNLGGTIRQDTGELQTALTILEHVSTQYQLGLSLDAPELPSDQADWIGQKQKVLSSWEKAKWPYTFSQVIDGIKQVGESYGFGQILQSLTTAFQRAKETSRLQEELDRVTAEILSLTDMVAQRATNPQERVNETATSSTTHSATSSATHSAASSANHLATSSATQSATSGPPSASRSRADSPELIVIDDSEDGISHKRRQVLTFPDTNIETKRRRMHDINV